MKRFAIKVALITLVFSSPVFAQNLRQYVCIVREQFSQETKDWLKETGEYLSKKGYPKYAKVVNEVDNNTFGSGFLYVAPNGKNYIITNRHVVSTAENATVQFEKEDGSYTTYENLKVVATDKELDLALLEFEGGKNPFKTGLPIARTSVTDGEEIWTAGFPGLAGNPSWQLGKGNVTNANTRLKELVDPSISLLIQHSAPVDAGNSGGPLLRQRGGSYEVVGVNTWKVSWRQSTNLSMPASSLQKFIQQGKSVKISSLEERANAFCKELQEDDFSLSNIEKYIAKSYTRETGAEYLVEILRNINSAERTYVLMFFENSPMNGFTAAVAANMIVTFLKNDFIKDCTIGEAQEQEDGTYKIEFTNGKKTVSTIWKQESAIDGGQWCLCGFADEKNSGKGKSGISSASSNSGFRLEKPYPLSLGMGWMNSGVEKSGIGLKANFSTTNFFGVTADFDLANFGDKSYVVVSPGVRLCVPLNFGDFFIVPYGTAGFSVCLGNFAFGYFYGGGLEAGYRFGSFSIFAFGEFTNKTISAGLASSDKDHSRAAPSFGLAVGFGY